MNSRREPILSIAIACAMATCAVSADAQPASPIERVTLNDAIQRTFSRNPTVAEARASILRAEALLQQIRAGIRPTVSANAVTTVVGPVRRFEDTVITPRTQTIGTLDIGAPVLAASRWALRTQAADQVRIAEVGADEVRRQLAIATAESYLGVIAQRRVVELNERSRDTARAHFQLAQDRERGGVGSRLNELRAQQELSSDDVRLEQSRLALLRAQEALGVLMATEAPVDAAEEPAFETPAEPQPEASWLEKRTDLRLFTLREQAADRVVRDSWKDWLPSVNAMFQPSFAQPSNFFLPPATWRALFTFNAPIFDAGERKGLVRERESLLVAVKAGRESAVLRARSEVRVAREGVASADRALEAARAAAAQASEVLKITDVAFRAGATSNIEVVDAQRRARDAETAVAIAEDEARRARLELMIALGRFP